MQLLATTEYSQSDRRTHYSWIGKALTSFLIGKWKPTFGANVFLVHIRILGEAGVADSDVGRVVANGERSPLVHDDGIQGISGDRRVKSSFDEVGNRGRSRRQSRRKVEGSRQKVVDLVQRGTAVAEEKKGRGYRKRVKKWKSHRDKQTDRLAYR